MDRIWLWINEKGLCLRDSVGNPG
ncbi:hypothetical protein MTBSS4_160004 [Magnetospirillum sp. SS-4]|nr:hypothetical protein MTBSS4_160004 [Magnetospirillum sp. SS-4]